MEAGEKKVSEKKIQEGEEERTRQLLLHNMCCGQMVLNYVLRVLTRFLYFCSGVRN